MNPYAHYIDHTNLKQNATKKDIITLCHEAKEHHFFSVCVNPGYVSLCAKELEGTSVKVCTVIGFPLGATTTESKVYETKVAVEQGVGEIDMVINVSRLKDKDNDFVLHEIKQVVDQAQGRLVKVIIETCLLTDEEKIRACQLSEKAGARFVKTSTGFSTGGATVNDVKLMRASVSSSMGVKASGGIRTKADFEAMIQAGATRIGTSSGILILAGGTSNTY